MKLNNITTQKNKGVSRHKIKYFSPNPNTIYSIANVKQTCINKK